jgi:UDP-N-acetylmuramoyl-L-alanyl-D-glutamate--2,6-diaminopimelate ligase
MPFLSLTAGRDMQLKELIEDIDIKTVKGGTDLEIGDMHYDSRRIKAGDLFVAIKGHQLDGHDYISDAVQKGAAGVLSELPATAVAEMLHDQKEHNPVFIQVENSRRALSRLAVKFYGYPFRKMSLIGITGTNGKTTTSYLLESILMAAGRKPGVIGTINRRFAGLQFRSSVTTPESLDLMKILRKMADRAATDVIMEVSSHALDQGRVIDCPFRLALFTNISRDHLDYHKSLDDYFKAKSHLFTNPQNNHTTQPFCAVINADDPWGRRLLEISRPHVLTYGLQNVQDVTARDVAISQEGLRATLVFKTGVKANIQSRLIGNFDIYNIMAAAAAAIAMGLSVQDIKSGIERMEGVPGRMELIKNNRSLAIVVDYAHTPDALLKAILAAKEIVHGRIFTVFGCGGDRDRGKRVEMGQIAGENSDRVFITSDNPRSEEPAAIAGEIEKGVVAAGNQNYQIELNRKKAIQMAIETASPGDLVLIAGKGHEDYQIVGSKKRDFDDRLVAAQAAAAP